MAEHKFYDVEKAFISTGGNGITSAGQIYPLTDLLQGNTDITRIGDKATGLSLQLRWTIEPPNLANQERNLLFRMIIFIWKDDTTPVLADILNVSAVVQQAQYFLNHDRRVKRKVLLDKEYMFNAFSDGTNIWSMFNPSKAAVEYINLSKLKRGLNIVNFEGGTTTAINHIYMLLITDAATSINSYDCKLATRFNFVDM